MVIEMSTKLLLCFSNFETNCLQFRGGNLILNETSAGIFFPPVSMKSRNDDTADKVIRMFYGIALVSDLDSQIAFA